jgi:hypothetical protein
LFSGCFESCRDAGVELGLVTTYTRERREVKDMMVSALFDV